MIDLKQLRERIEQLETEIESVTVETKRLQRAYWRKFAAGVALSLFPVLLLGACLGMAQTAPGNRVHAPFEVDDSLGRRIFLVGNDHAFYVYAENSGATSQNESFAGTPTLVAHALTGDISFSAAQSDTGTWAKLGMQEAVPPFLELDAGGDERVMVVGANGKPELSMRNTSGIKVFDLLQGKAFPGGELGLFNGRGQLRVRAGASEAGIGRVEAFPLGNPIGSAIVGRVR